MLNADSFIDKYIKWLKQNTKALNLSDGIVEITTPFLDRHNDSIQIYVVQDGDGYTLTDDGYTIADLEISGLLFNTNKRKQELEIILNGFGIQLGENGALYCKCNDSNFPAKKHNLMQSILAVNDLFVLSRPNVASFFAQDVESFLADNDIRYTSNVKFTGKSGFDHAYDFVIPHSKASPDRLIKSVNSLDRTRTESIIFAWNDTLKTRPEGTQLYTFVNDDGKNISKTNSDALKEYGIIPVQWKEKSNMLPALVS